MSRAIECIVLDFAFTLCSDLYFNSFLVEDGEESPKRFRELGGVVYRYTNDDAFTLWAEKNPL